MRWTALSRPSAPVRAQQQNRRYTRRSARGRGGSRRLRHLSQEDHSWWSGKLGENFALDNVHGGRELKLDSLPKKGGDQADPLGQVTQEFATVPNTTQQGVDLLQIPRHGNFDQCGHVFLVWTLTGG